MKFLKNIKEKHEWIDKHYIECCFVGLFKDFLKSYNYVVVENNHNFELIDLNEYEVINKNFYFKNTNKQLFANEVKNLANFGDILSIQNKWYKIALKEIEKKQMIQFFYNNKPLDIRYDIFSEIFLNFTSANTILNELNYSKDFKFLIKEFLFERKNKEKIYFDSNDLKQIFIDNIIVKEDYWNLMNNNYANFKKVPEDFFKEIKFAISDKLFIDDNSFEIFNEKLKEKYYKNQKNDTFEIVTDVIIIKVTSYFENQIEEQNWTNGIDFLKICNKIILGDSFNIRQFIFRKHENKIYITFDDNDSINKHKEMFLSVLNQYLEVCKKSNSVQFEKVLKNIIDYNLFNKEITPNNELIDKKNQVKKI